MADLKISALPASTVPLAGTEVLPIVQSSTTKQVSIANLTAGRTQTSNGIVQGTAATGYNFTANTPAAGMTSRLLNWYEEGTWTPTDASGAGLVFIGAEGRYTRIGRQVTVNLFAVYPATASVLAAKIGGLPFALTAVIAAAGGAWGYTNGSGAAQYTIDPGASIIQIFDNVGAARTNLNMSLTYNIVTFSYIV